MLPFKSNEQYPEIDKNKRQQIFVVGVSHVKANLNPVLAILDKLELDSDTAIFIEPKRSILTGKEVCTNKSIEFFFANVIQHVIRTKAKIIPLNPSIMPSHSSVLLYHKFANQLAEEEYMAELVKKSNYKKKVIIIGNSHASRLKDLLEKTSDARYLNTAPVTPDDILSDSWRKAIQGKNSSFISIKWLNLVNKEIKNMLKLNPDSKVQESCWDDERMFERYLIAAKLAMQKYKIKQYMMQMHNDIRESAGKIKENGKTILKHYQKEEDHAVFAYPYTIKLIPSYA